MPPTSRFENPFNPTTRANFEQDSESAASFNEDEIPSSSVDNHTTSADNIRELFRAMKDKLDDMTDEQHRRRRIGIAAGTFELQSASAVSMGFTTPPESAGGHAFYRKSVFQYPPNPVSSRQGYSNHIPDEENEGVEVDSGSGSNFGLPNSHGSLIDRASGRNTPGFNMEREITTNRGNTALGTTLRLEARHGLEYRTPSPSSASAQRITTSLPFASDRTAMHSVAQTRRGQGNVVSGAAGEFFVHCHNSCPNIRYSII